MRVASTFSIPPYPGGGTGSQGPALIRTVRVIQLQISQIRLFRTRPILPPFGPVKPRAYRGGDEADAGSAGQTLVPERDLEVVGVGGDAEGVLDLDHAVA